jgi:hypothetical protein
MSFSDDSQSELRDNDFLELDDSSQHEDLESEFNFEMGNDLSQTEISDTDQQFVKKMEAILQEVNSQQFEEGVDMSKFSQELKHTLKEMDSEYFSLFKALSKGIKKLAPHVIPGGSIISLVQKISPSARRMILNTLGRAAMKYAPTLMKYGLPAIPGVGNVASVAGPLLASAGVPGLKSIFEYDGKTADIPSTAQNFVHVAHDAMEYAYKNLEVDSDDPLKAQQLANNSINYALQKLQQYRGTTGGYSTPAYPETKDVYIKPGQSITFRFIGTQ